MSEESNEKKIDDVSMEEHNKVVGAHNSVKTENEELKKKLESFEKKEQVTEEKKEWETKATEMEKQIQELKQQVTEKKDDVKVAKGVVPTAPVTQQTSMPAENLLIKKQLDEQFPDRKQNPENFASPLLRYGFYKNGTTRTYTNEQLGMALSLHASAQNSNPRLINPDARANRGDTVVYRTPIQ